MIPLCIMKRQYQDQAVSDFSTLVPNDTVVDKHVI